MKILMMVMADYASIDSSTGKIHILGLFRQMWAQTFPITHHRMCLVVKIEGEISDSRNPHKLSVALTDEDGVEMIAIEGGFEMLDSPPGIPPECNMVLELNALVFQKPGEYRFYARINDDEAEESVVMQVIQRQPG